MPVTNKKNLAIGKGKVWFREMEVVAWSRILFKELKNGYYDANAF